MFYNKNKREKRLFTFTFLIMIILFAAAYSAEDSPVKKTAREEIPAEAVSFSASFLEESVNELVMSGETTLHSTCVISIDLEDEIDAAIDSILSDSYPASCILEDITFSMTRKDTYAEVDYSLVYNENTVFAGEIHTITKPEQLVPALIEGFLNGTSKAAFLFEGCFFSENELFDAMNNAELNVALSPCEASNLVYEAFPPKNDQQLVFFWCEVRIGQEEWDQKQAVLKDSLDDVMSSLSYDTSDPSACYAAAYQTILASADYDYDLSASTLLGAENLTPQMHVSRSAYGALVEGMTVCTGYARAYKALCDAMGLPCWVVAGTKGDVEHAWNAVSLDGQVYYVDCTIGDSESAEASFLFSDEQANAAGYTISDFSVILW